MRAALSSTAVGDGKTSQPEIGERVMPNKNERRHFCQSSHNRLVSSTNTAGRTVASLPSPFCKVSSGAMTDRFDITIPQADDFHHHFRDGDVLKDTVRHATRMFRRAVSEFSLHSTAALMYSRLLWSPHVHTLSTLVSSILLYSSTKSS